MADSKVGIIIEAKNKTSGAINQVKTELGGLNSAAGLASKAMGAFALAGGVAGIAMAGRVAFSLVEASAQADRLGVSFNQLAVQAGTTGDDILAAMTKASRGTISNVDMMAAANKAMLLGVADSAEEFTQLLEVASARGKAMGLSTAQAFGDLVTGIGRMSPMILDNLGILTGGAKAFDIYAESIGKTADQLSDAEKKQYLLNAAVSSSADLIAANKAAGGDMADDFERMDAAIKNSKIALGEMFGPAMAKVAEAIAQNLQSMAGTAVQNNLAAAQELTAGLVERYKAVQEAQAEAAYASAGWVQQQVVLNNLAEQIRSVYEAAGLVPPKLAELSAETDRLDMAAIQASQDLMDLARAHDAAGIAALNQASKESVLAGAASEVSGIVGQYRGQLLGMVDSLGASGALGSLNKFNEAMKTQALLLEDQFPTEDNADRRAFMLQEYADGWLKANGLIQDHVTGLSAATTAIDPLLGKVQSLLSSQLDPGVGVNPADFLPREDAINEDARRLADVAVNGYNSPWYSYLNDKFPGMFDEALTGNGGDIQAAAASMLQDFQAGLKPELLDKEAAKERIKAMLTGDANMAALAAEISAELQAEMGGQFSAADIAKATGTALGSDKAMVTGLEGTGKAAVTTVTGEIDGAADLLKTSGEGAGRNWGSGFLATVGENIPTQLIEILSTIVTPGVWAKIQALGGLTVPEGAS